MAVLTTTVDTGGQRRQRKPGRRDHLNAHETAGLHLLCAVQLDTFLRNLDSTKGVDQTGHPTAVDGCWAGRPWALGSQPPEMLVSHRAFGDPMPLTLSQPGPVLSEESWLKVRTL